MTGQIVPKDETFLVNAFKISFGSKYPLKYYDDSFGPLWVYSQEYRPMIIIRANSWYSAYEIAIDELETIDESELWEAYGFDSEEEFNLYVEETEHGDWDRDLVEGYTYQSNFTGTGIVFVGYNETLSPLTKKHIKGMGLLVKLSTEWS